MLTTIALSPVENHRKRIRGYTRHAAIRPNKPTPSAASSERACIVVIATPTFLICGVISMTAILRKIYCFNYGLCAYYAANLSETRNTQDCLQ